MDNKIHNAFEHITASQELKERTRLYLLQHRHREQKQKKRQLPALTAACACMLLLCSYQIWNIWMRPVAFVSIDVNPSIELWLSSKDTVVKAQGFNQEGVQQLEAVSLKGIHYQQAVTQLLERQVADGYLNDAGLVSFAVQTGDEARGQQILQNLEGCVQSLELDVSLHCCMVDQSLWEEAVRQGISPGRYKAILDLMEVDPGATWEGCRHSSMSELLERTERCRNGQRGAEGGHGHGKRHIDTKSPATSPFVAGLFLQKVK